MNKKQIDFIKHCGEHFEILTGGRGHSKTKETIEKLEQENQQLKNKTMNKLNEIMDIITETCEHCSYVNKCLEEECQCYRIEQKVIELMEVINE